MGFTLSAGLGMLGVAKMLAQVAIGIGVGVAMWAAGTALAGGQLTWEGLGNAALDSFLASSAVAFISSGINYIQYLSRSTPATTAELAQETSIKDMSYNDMLPNEKAAYDGYANHGWQGNYPGQAKGVRAGGTYLNKNNVLPNAMYREFDINPAIQGIGRDASRFVVSNDYVVYLTRDHYATFFRIIK